MVEEQDAHLWETEGEPQVHSSLTLTECTLGSLKVHNLMACAGRFTIPLYSLLYSIAEPHFKILPKST